MTWASFCHGTANAKTFALSDTKDLILLNVKAEATEYKGRTKGWLRNPELRSRYRVANR
jgi:hypothetical protein